MYKIEGIGQGSDPEILDRTNIDDWIVTGDQEAFKCARDLIKHEGLFVGGSCGSAMIGALKYLKEKGLNNNMQLRCAVFFPDSTQNY